MDNSRCPECGTEIGPGLLACPGCARLVHAEELKQIAAEASAAEKQQDLSAALAAWRRTLDLLPPDSRQHAEILARIRELSAHVDEGAPAAPKRSMWKKGAAGVGALALLLFKSKTLLLFLFTKGKFLLLGLTKMKTLLSMFLFFAVYWTAFGWKFAGGIALSIYIHEMGHVWMLRRYGISATAPMFIPGFGAIVRLNQYPATPIEDARVGLAGPIWGMGAALACFGIYLATETPIWAALAQAGAMINLFNLIPVWQLDGGRGMNSLTRGQRWLVAAAAGGLYFFMGESDLVWMIIIFLAAAARAVVGEAPKERDDFGLFQYVLLLLVLGAVSALDVPGLTR